MVELGSEGDDVLTGRRVRAQVPVAELLNRLPVALIVR